MSDICEWCEGAGCDECDTTMINTPSNPTPGNDSPNIIITPSTFVDCEWCQGAGCDECQPDLQKQLSPQMGCNNGLPTPNLVRTSSILVPECVNATIPTAVDENMIVSYMSYRLHQLAKTFWVSLDDAEVLLRSANWNDKQLKEKWSTFGGDEVRKVLGLPPISPLYSTQPPSTTTHYLDLKRRNLFQSQNNMSNDDNNNDDFVSVNSRAMVDDDSTNTQSTFECPICQDDIILSNTTLLPCGHRFCNDCFYQNIVSLVDEGQKAAINARCPGISIDASHKVTKCDYLLPWNLVIDQMMQKDANMGVDPSNDELKEGKKFDFTKMTVHSHNDTTTLFRTLNAPEYDSTRKTYAGRMRRWMIEAFIEGARTEFTACASPHSCPLFVYTPRNGATLCPPDVQIITSSVYPTNLTYMCPCGFFSCIGCNTPGGHWPASCELAYEYIDRTDPDALSRRLIEASTKSCPKCGVPTTKEKHCNHVRCSKCDFHWCYLCKSDMSKHNNYYFCEQQARDNFKDDDAKEEFGKILVATYEIQKMFFFHNSAKAFEGFNHELLKTYHQHISTQSPSSPAVLAAASVPVFTKNVQIFWTACSMIPWLYACSSFIPNSHETLVFRSQKALFVGVVRHVHGIVTKYVEDVISLANSALNIAEFREEIDRTRNCVDRINKVCETTPFLAFFKAWEERGKRNREAIIAQKKAQQPSDRRPVQNAPQAVIIPNEHGDDDDDDSSDEDDEDAPPANVTTTSIPAVITDAVTFDVTTEEWSCTACGCLHIPTKTELLFDSIDVGGQTLFYDITNERSKSASAFNKKRLAQYNGIYKNSSGSIVCANCLACQSHNDDDCRICIAKHRH